MWGENKLNFASFFNKSVLTWWLCAPDFPFVCHGRYPYEFIQIRFFVLFQSGRSTADKELRECHRSIAERDAELVSLLMAHFMLLLVLYIVGHNKQLREDFHSLAPFLSYFLSLDRPKSVNLNAAKRCFSLFLSTPPPPPPTSHKTQ